MDSHLRTYFSSNSVQLDIDASLFAKAMEMVDPSLAKKLFVDMAIAPIRVCRPWSVSLVFRWKVHLTVRMVTGFHRFLWRHSQLNIFKECGTYF